MSETGTFTGEIWRQPYTAQQLQDAAANQIPIIRNGYWYTWDIATGLFVNSGVPADVATGKLNIIGKGINLLDNAYFIGGGSQQGGGQLPINERGQTSYIGAAYGINRWFFYAQTGISLTPSGLLTPRLDSIVQPLSIATITALTGRTVTTSVLTAAGELYFGTIDAFAASGDPQYFVNGNIVILAMDSFSRSIQIFASTEQTIAAAMLEIGATQSLAHQDSNGNWLLNSPPPTYGLELIKCATSRADSSDTYANKSIVFQ